MVGPGGLQTAVGIVGLIGVRIQLLVIGVSLSCCLLYTSIAVAADLTLEQVVLSSQDMLLLPGGKGGVESMQMDLFALALIQKAHTVGCYLAAICAAPTLLAHLGLLDRRSAVCYPCLLYTAPGVRHWR